jgi:hypothetical protein
METSNGIDENSENRKNETNTTKNTNSNIDEQGLIPPELMT